MVNEGGGGGGGGGGSGGVGIVREDECFEVFALSCDI